MPAPKGKKPATPGKKEEKPEAKKPQEKKADAPAKAKKEGAPKPAPKKKDPATKPAAGADAGKGKDKGKKRKLNETTQGKAKQGAAGTDSKKKKVEKKVQGKAGAAAKKTVGKKPVRKQLARKSKTLKRGVRHWKPKFTGKQEVVVYEGRRYFLLPSGKLKAMLDIKLETNDKAVKVEGGAFIRKTDVKALEEFKESIKSSPASLVGWFPL
ncbi:hypothetical protein GWK47_025119 [Chionoecetes opilio]|uniref:Uncharacterized protein n=1 Tax=Chionoecetes opilio TaxID=41210 RepID=A0A8J4XMW3_CHIOP|nr:hypothetical protein GWK47_025119 [Chionoecetes opilio]